MRAEFLALAALSMTLTAPLTLAAATSDIDPNQVQPYIEQLRKRNGIVPRPYEPDGARPQTQYLKPGEQPRTSAPPSAPQSGAPSAKEIQPFIESLRERNELPPSDSPEGAPANLKGDFSVNPKEVQPHIESLRSGYELEPRYPKKTRDAAGFGVVASNRFNVQSDRVQANAFETVYDTKRKYSMGFDLFYEKQLYRSWYTGAIGPMVHLNYINAKGKGVFSKNGNVAQDAKFSFFAVPVTFGMTYRFLMLKYLVPYVEFGGVAIPFMEFRDDDKPSRKGFSRGFSAIGGMAFNLDWLAPGGAWDRFEHYGVVHTYLTVQWQFLRTIASAVSFNYDGVYGGLTFEY